MIKCICKNKNNTVLYEYSCYCRTQININVVDCQRSQKTGHCKRPSIYDVNKEKLAVIARKQYLIFISKYLLKIKYYLYKVKYISTKCIKNVQQAHFNINKCQRNINRVYSMP